MTTSDECRHANTDNCHECLRNELKQFEKLFTDPDVGYLDPPELYTGLRRHIKFAIDRIGDMEQNEIRHVAHDHSDAESFHTTREESSEQQKTLQPKVVAGSGFGRRKDVQSVSPKRPPKPTSPSKPPTPPRVPGSPPGTNRMKWSAEETEQLRQGVSRFGTQWKTIRENYPALKRFSNIQLKDKHRAAFGSRSSI